MATTVRKLRVVGNPGNIIGFTLANPGARSKKSASRKKVHTMAKTKKRNFAFGKSSSTPKKRKRNGGFKMKSHRRRSNPGQISDGVNTALFIIAGAVGSKLGAQAILGSKNTGVMGYAGNAAVGAALYLLLGKFMKSRAASMGILYGTLVQIILRAISDYTPFGQYVANLGMGDYQAQSFVTPQVLVDPNYNATLANGWNPPAMPVLAAPVAASGMGGTVYSGSSVYN